MKLKYPKYSVYNDLYKRYFKRNVTELIKLADVKQDDAVLDVCGGNGRLSIELTKYSKDVSYLDQEKDMIPNDLSGYGVTVYNLPIQKYIDKANRQYDKVFCQQAINYWLLHIDIKQFSNLIKKDGLFVFNTFANKPTERPMIKEYEIDLVKYIEISYLVDGRVYHIQVRESHEPHFTIFDWIDGATYDKLLKPYFDVKIYNDGNTLLYVCRRK